MRINNEIGYDHIYGYDGQIPLTKSNWKCASCANFSALTKPCFTGYTGNSGKFKTTFPDIHLEPIDNCQHYDIIKNDKITLNQQLDEQADKIKYIEQHKDEMIGDNIFIPETQTFTEPDNVGDTPIDEEEYNNFKNNLITKANNLHDALTTALDNGQDYSVNTNIPDLIEVKGTANNGKTFTATVQMEPTWGNEMKEIAIDKAKAELDKQIAVENALYSKQIEEETLKTEQNELTAEDKEQLQETRKLINKLLQDNNTEAAATESSGAEEMLDGDIRIGWFMQTTSWLRVVNAARRTIGKNPIITDPSDSWKAKILLAEHSPIRLLEYDWGWEKIRQWVTVHLVRHHEGVEKFVHSQRSDRRELPCDRDHIYQGARNDMDMTANAQGLINMSRKRCCNCASAETREAWKLVLDELEKKDPVMRAKCVRECVYRGFCPEWMSKCGYYKTDAFKKERADYVNTLYGKDVKYHFCPGTPYIIFNTGHIYNKFLFDENCTSGITIDDSLLNNLSNDMLKEVEYEKEWINGHYNIKIKDSNYSVDTLVYNAFNNDGNIVKDYQLLHIDGNEWNNNINNLKLVTK